MALRAGDLVFLGYDADNNDVVLLTTSTIAAGEVIYFTDDEWNGTSFNNANEQLIEWTVPNDIDPGTVLTLDMIRGPNGQVPRGSAEIYQGTSPGDPADLVGGINYIRGGGSLAGNNEQLWILQGDVDPDTGEIAPTGSAENPSGFISVVSNEAVGDQGGPNLANTGLSSDNGAVIIDGDEDFMIFDPVLALGDRPFAEAPEVVRDTLLELVGDPSNWTTEDGGGNQNPGAGFDFNLGQIGGIPVPIRAADDVTTLYFTGDKVAFVDSIDDADVVINPGGGVSEFSTTLTFEPTDIFEIDIVTSDIQSRALEGEFDFNQVIFTRVTLIRNGVAVDFDVDPGSKVKETGGANSGTKEQGDSFFSTADDVSTPSSLPFPSIQPNFSGTMVFSLDDAFIDGNGDPIDPAIPRSRPDLDTNGDGNLDGGTPFNNENFNVGTVDMPPPIPCFVAGTLIRTPAGYRLIETLDVGDLVETLDNGPQPIRWVGRRVVDGRGKHAPIRFAPGAIGNRRALCVSPQHRVLVSGWQCELHLHASEVLCAAKHLCDGDRISRAPCDRVEYVHIMFDNHEIVDCDHAFLESFYAGDHILRSDVAVYQELTEIFPELADNDFSQCPARPFVGRTEAALLNDFS